MNRTLRNLEPSDLKHLVAWRNDPEVNRYLASTNRTLDDVKAWFERLQPDENTFLKGVCLDEELVGYCLAENVDATRSKCEVGIVIARQAWGKGLGMYALGELLAHCFDCLHLHRVLAVIARGNERSRLLFENAGFIHEGTLREATLIDGHFTDLLLLSMLDREYQRNT